MKKLFKSVGRCLSAGLFLFGAVSVLPVEKVAFAAPSAKAFGELPVVYDASISPDGSKIAVIVNINGEYGVFVKSIVNSNAAPDLVRLGKEVKPKFVKWVNDKRWVVSIRKLEVYKDTPYTASLLYSYNIETKIGDFLATSKRIFRQSNDRVVDWLEDDPDNILMEFSDKQFDRYPDIKLVNVETGKIKTVKSGQYGVEYWVSDDDGTPRVGYGKTERDKDEMVIFNSATGKWESYDQYPGLEADTDIYGILKDGTELVIGDYQGKDTIGLYIYDLGQKKITRELFHDETYDVSGVVLSKDGESVIGAKYTADRDKTELLDEYDTYLDRLRRRYSENTISFVDQTQDGKTMLVRMSSPNEPGGLLLYTADNDKLVPLSPMYNGIKGSDLGTVLSVSYKARDGADIPAFITLPKRVPSKAQMHNIPFIVLPHGGPYGRDSKEFDYFAQFFATRGYGVLQMNFRGSDGYGKTHEEAGRSNWVVMQEDVEDGARWLLAQGYSDPQKTCIAGWSYGGYAALMGVATDPDLYKCAIAMAALTDIDEAKEDLEKYVGGEHAAKKFFGEAFEDKSLRKANSPVNVADRITVPVFLAHGDKDSNVQFNQFERMKKALERAGTDATYLEFKDEDHYLSTQKNREEFFIEIEKFLEKVNGKSEYMTP